MHTELLELKSCSSVGLLCFLKLRSVMRSLYPFFRSASCQNINSSCSRPHPRIVVSPRSRFISFISISSALSLATQMVALARWSGMASCWFKPGKRVEVAVSTAAAQVSHSGDDGTERAANGIHQDEPRTPASQALDARLARTPTGSDSFKHRVTLPCTWAHGVLPDGSWRFCPRSEGATSSSEKKTGSNLAIGLLPCNAKVVFRPLSR